MNKKYILGIFLLVILLSVGIFLLREDFTAGENTPSTEERLLSAIINDIPAFSYNGKPTIEIDSISALDDGWYVVTIKSLRSSGNFVPVKLIMFDMGGMIRVIYGPDTSFSEPELLKRNVPDSVIIELRKS